MWSGFWLKRRSVALAIVATLVVHLLFLKTRLGSDEGGFATVGRFWTTGGHYLYGPQWVDRPPGLIALFSFADHLGPLGVRLTATLLAVGLVAALAWTAEAVGGRPAARWAAWAGFAFGSSVLFEAQQLNGELAAATFVTLSVGAVLRALRVSRSRTQTLSLGAISGASAATAVLMKQNFVDGFVFAGVLIGVGLASRSNRLTYRAKRTGLTAGGFILGAGAPLALTLVWASTHGGVAALAYAVVGFRGDAARTMASWSWTAPMSRLGALAVVSWFSGLLLLGGHLGYRHRRRLRRLEPLPWAIVGTGAVELFSVLAGQNYWPHYLIALVPMVALTAGLGANRRLSGAAWTRRLVALAIGVTAVTSTISGVTSMHATSEAYTTGRWVAAAAKPGDTISVPFTHANVIYSSGLRPAYPYAWSLPTRTLDPHLTLLVNTLDGPRAPTWVVRWDKPNTWGLDPTDRVGQALLAHYKPVADVCGHQVWLRDTVSRRLAPAPSRSVCGGGEG